MEKKKKIMEKTIGKSTERPGCEEVRPGGKENDGIVGLVP
jgi:hypothetical protein